MSLDAHHHFWSYDPTEYGWIDDSMARLRRDFLPADLEVETKAAGIDGVISVQSSQTVAHTEWLLGLARQHDWIYGVVGWVPLVAPDVRGVLERLAVDNKLCGVRHVLQGEADEFYMLRSDFNQGVRALGEFDLVYDILIFERHLPQTIEFVDLNPGQSFVLDHLAKPVIKEQRFEPWRANLAELAKRENVTCKVSGMITEANWQTWSPTSLQPYFETVLECFGPARLMFGSDWPVCLAAGSYAGWIETVRGWTATLSATEQRQIFHETASNTYGVA